MPSFEVAHINREGVDLIITPVNESFGRATHSEQIETVEALESAAHEAGPKGTVVPVWQVGNRMGLIVPNPWHPFLSSLTFDDIFESVNREISW